MDPDSLLSDDSALDAALADLDVEAAVAPSSNFDPTSSSRNGKRALELPTALGGSTGDYRDGEQYLPTGFGEIGLYLRNKRKKLQVQNKALLEDGQEHPQLFKGLAIYINGYTESIGLAELTEILVRHGGVYVPYLDQKALVTHIIATNLTPTKRKEFASYKVATPDWLVESVKEGKLLDWRQFSLLAPSRNDDGPKRTGWEEEKDRMGTQTGQKSLFSMMGPGRTASSATAKGKSKELPSRPRTPPVASTSAVARETNVETRESLSERGARLARAALEEQKRAASAAHQSFFQPRRPPTPIRRDSPTTPTKPETPRVVVAKGAPTTTSARPLASDLSATTDSPGPANAITSSWLPQKKRDERTTALINDRDWLAKHTSASEDFLKGYFAQSRLHHLSSFKEDLKIMVASKQAGQGVSRKKKLTGTAADGRTIFHVDFDCFFVSAGLTTRPELRGRPVAVCHARGAGDSLSSTSEIASCSYEARAFGVKNGMSLGRARELCPDVQTMPFEFEQYKDFSLKFYNILLSHAHVLQAVSMDEVLLEVKVPPTVTRENDPALALAHSVRSEIFAATGCPASIGISHNITLARLATRKAKPASAYHLLPEEVRSFLAPLNVDSLPGIGYSLRHKLADELGVTTVGGLLDVRPSELARVIGAGNAQKFGAYARGIDDRELEVGKPRKSVSAEVNYGIRFEAGRDDQVERFVKELGEEVASRLRQEGLKARQLTLKVMTRHPDAPVDAPKLLGHGWVTTENKQSNLSGPGGTATDDNAVIAETAWKMMKSLNAPAHELRGIGLQLHKLEKDGQSVDVIREKGQSKLSFAATSKSRAQSPVPALEPVPPRPSPPPAAPSISTSNPASDTEVLVLDSDSDAEIVPAPIRQPAKAARAVESASAILGRTRSRSTRAATRPVETYVPHMFRSVKKHAAPAPPTASQVSDDELTYYGIDVEFYRALDAQSRMEVLAQARRKKAPFAAKKNKQASVAAVAANAPAPSVIVLPPSSNDDLEFVEADQADGPPELRGLEGAEELRQVWGALGKATQQAQLRDLKARQALRVVGNKSKREGTSARNVGPVRDVAIRPEPRFTSKTDVDEIRSRIEQWVATPSDDLNEQDLEAFAKYLERCAARDNGHNLSKAVDLLKWWRCLLEDEHGTEADATKGTARAWWGGYERTVERLSYLVQKETGCRLSF
ncbi:hypothetical protein JCM10212_004170 [Sporobolomyces blumeae]